MSMHKRRAHAIPAHSRRTRACVCPLDGRGAVLHALLAKWTATAYGLVVQAAFWLSLRKELAPS